MGLDAYVNCTCYREGRTTPLPFADGITTDEDGQPRLDGAYNAERSKVFWQWKETCCAHPDMKYARERVGNWAGYGGFLAALEAAGWAAFPTLHETLPAGNGGTTSPTESEAALAELQHFAALSAVDRHIFLVDSDTGEPFYSTAGGGDLCIFGDDGLNLGYDRDGLFVVRRADPGRQGMHEAVAFDMGRVEAALLPDTPAPPAPAAPERELFRARRVEQRVVASDAAGRPTQAEYQDRDSAARITCALVLYSSVAIPWPDGRMQDDTGAACFAYPRRLHVEERVVGAAHFGDIVAALRTVFAASVATGNPVHWC